MIENAGMSYDLCSFNVFDMPFEGGYNIANGETCNMMEEGIIDPFKVIRCALQNAASAASTLLSSRVAIIEI